MESHENGGSMGGTAWAGNSADVITGTNSRLFANPTELAFNPDRTQDTYLPASYLSKLGFFLSTCSRAPETTVFNTPRISIWPLQSGTTLRNSKDNLLAFCSSIGSSGTAPYYFQRQSYYVSDSSPGSSQLTSGNGSDLDPGSAGGSRNIALLSYLSALTSANIPGFGGNFATAKYSGTMPQILAEIFDYIRSLVNTTSTSLAPYYSYTPYSNSVTAVGLAGVVPSVTGTTKGFGRFPTIKSVGILFIATGYRDFSNLNITGTTDSRYWPVAPAPIPNRNAYQDPAGPLYYLYVANGNSVPANLPTAPTPDTAHATAAFPAGYFPAFLSGSNPMPVPAAADGLPDDEPKITVVGGSNVCTFNGVGDPCTNQMQAIVLLNLFEPAPGMPDMSPAYRVQISGLNNLSMTCTSGTSTVSSSLGFGNSNQSTLLVRNSNSRFNSSEPALAEQFYYTNAGATAPRTLGYQASGGVTTSGSEGLPEEQIYPFYGSKVSIPSFDPPTDWGLDMSGTYQHLRSTGANPLTFAFNGSDIDINIYPGSPNAFGPSNLIQHLKVNLPSGVFPIPQIIRPKFATTSDSATVDASNTFVTSATSRYFYVGLTGSNPIQPGGIPPIILGNTTGSSSMPTPTIPYDVTSFNSRLALRIWNTTYIRGDLQMSPRFYVRRGDVFRSVGLDPNGPSKGDERLVAGLLDVPKDFFAPHPNYSNSTMFFAQQFIEQSGNYPTIVGWSEYPINSASKAPDSWSYTATTTSWPYYRGQLFNAPNNPGRALASPCAPPGMTAATSNSYPGDWDTGFAAYTDGPCIRKADEGYVGQTGTMMYYNVYFGANNNAASGTTSQIVNSYSPTRQIPSPVMFGSLPTGINQSTPDRSVPWQTLLFCPNPAAKWHHAGLGTGIQDPVLGAGYPQWPPYTSPPDHLLLDLFWMPVVEPYAISEPFSTAGKINLNEQIVPFSYITRNTGIYALIKHMRMPALSGTAATLSKGFFMSDGQANTDSCWKNPSLRYDVDVDATMMGFQNRFSQNDVFRSASEICSIYLVPKLPAGLPAGTANLMPASQADKWGGTLTPPSGTPAQRYALTKDWWDSYDASGDNLREDPYNHIYPRVTTKSNTYQVHYRVQLLKKRANSDQTFWEENKDQVVSEYRGSSILERYIDPNDSRLQGVDFATLSLSDPNAVIDKYYKFRVVSQKAFTP